MFLRWGLVAILGMSVGLALQARADDSGLVAVRLGNAVPWLGNGAVATSGDPTNSARLLGVSGTSWTAALPGWLRWALEPQVQVLPGAGSAGLSGEGYRGLSWSVPLASGVLHVDDGLSFGFSIGQSLGDPATGSDVLDRRTLSPTPLLRLGAAVGYQVTPRLGVALQFDHQSGSGAARLDDTENGLGILLGLRF